ncbi:transcription factor bHLH117 [Mercurialis annua]|uniref:transcription factor bHLH117 n=1 Tax=Mercurialis annua TaxID=3986 RepID=UPI00215EA334|nr:transcription factor bHLH117 [Mercurialis annua]
MDGEMNANINDHDSAYTSLQSLLPLPPPPSLYHHHHHPPPPPPSFSFFAADNFFTSIPSTETTYHYPDDPTLNFFDLNHLPPPSFHHRYASLFSGTNSNTQTLGVQKNKSKKRIDRQRMSDKIRELRKLMPWDKKMDTATLLGEAFKYVKFLQAQVQALETMPFLDMDDSSSSSLSPPSGYYYYNTDNAAESEDDVSVCGGTMGLLSRQQLLQILLNTGEAQNRLYSQGCCVFSIEQFKKFVADQHARARDLAAFLNLQFNHIN